MIYDIPLRHQQALDPSALTTIQTTLHAIEQAIGDCRNAGVQPDTDPAVVLLARHLAVVSTNRAPDEVLRSACLRRIEGLRRFPTLLALAIGGVEYEPVAKARFHLDGRKAMRALADALELAQDDYVVSSREGEPSSAGEVSLLTPDFAVSLTIGGVRQGREVLYQATRVGIDTGQRRFAPIAELLAPSRFAARLRRELSLRELSTVEPRRSLLPA